MGVMFPVKTVDLFDSEVLNMQHHSSSEHSMLCTLHLRAISQSSSFCFTSDFLLCPDPHSSPWYLWLALVLCAMSLIAGATL